MTKFEMHAYFRFLIFGFLVCTGTLKAQPHCKLGWIMQPYFCDMDSMILTAYAFGGAEPYTFLWSTGETTQSIYALNSPSATYSVTITGVTGCTASGAITLGVDLDPYINGSTQSCENFPIYLDASFPFLVTPPPGVTYLWSTGQTTYNISVLTSGTYTVTFTDPANGCTFVASQTVNFSPAPEPVIIGPQEICGGQSITITTSGGPFNEYYWIPLNQNTESVSISSPGTYIVQVQGSNGCYGYDTISISNGVALTINGTPTPTTSCTSPNGAVDISVTPPGSYQYAWSNGATTQNIQNLSAGLYTITVSSSGGCTVSASYMVDDNTSPPELTINTTNATCGQSNGSINLTITPPGSYTFNWSNGSSQEDLTTIPGGTYAVTVTAANGCTATVSEIVSDNPISFNLSETIAPNTTCLPANGSIDLSVTPSGTYSFLWSNGATTEDVLNLPGGLYMVTVTTGLTCTAIQEYTVPDQTIEPNFTGIITPATCGESNGGISLEVNSGTPPFTFSWSGGSTEQSLVNVPGGIYTVTVTGTDGCTASEQFEIPDNAITISINGIPSPNTSCNGENGSIDIEIAPSGSYTYQWSNGSTTEDLTNLSSGDYLLTVTLGSTCSETASFFVSNEIALIAVTGVVSHNTSCNQPNGSVDVTINPVNSYTYTWSNGETNEDLSQLTGGIYNITVTGTDGCTSSAVFEIINTSSNFSVSGNVTSNTSCTSPNGTVDLSPSPAGSYLFTWSNGESSEDILNLSAGIYGVTVSDINSCSSVASFSVVDSLSLPEISALLLPATCNGTDGAIDLSVTPAIGNTFLWSSGSVTEDLSNLAPGNYSVTVTGANGCISSDTFLIINQNSNFTLSAIPTANNSCLNPNGSIDLTITPSASYSFIWSNAAVTEDVQNLSAGNYTVTVTDNLNCSSSDTFTVLNNTSIPSLTANITPAVCGASNGGIDLMVIPGVNNSFLWSNGAVTEDLVNVSPSAYSVIVTDANGCQALDTFDILNTNTSFSFSALPTSNTSCLNPNGSIDLSVTPLGTYTFLWSNGTAAEDLTSISAGSYTVTITDAAACSSTGTFVVADNTPLITISSIVNPSVCGAGNGSIDLTITPSAGNIFSWSNGDLTEDVQNLNAGNFSVTVTDPGGCFASDTFTVPELGSSFTLSGFQTANTNCIAPNGSIDLTVTPNGVYSYIWSNTITAEDQASLAPGTYTVTVSDVNGCSSTESFIVSDQTIQPVITETIVPSTCGNANGQIDIAVSPAGSYLFVWSNGSATEDLSNVPSGMYAVTVTDINGCSAATSLVVTNTNSNFSLTAIPSANTSCTQSNGAINLTVAPSGIYTFLWSNGAISEDLVNIPAGTYTVTVSDATNCSSSDTYLVDDQTVNLLVVETITPVLCGEANGSIDLEVTPPSGNNFNWSDGSTTEDITDILPGQYSVTVTGQNGCVWTSGFNVPGNGKLEIELQADVIQSGDDFVTIRAQVNIPLTALDTIMWLPEALFDCNQDFCLEQTITRPAAQTEIKVIAIDTNGCLAQASLKLDEVSNPKVFIPNVFSPDADGINDMFTVYGNKDVEMIDELQIFDRWGNQVFVNTEFPPNEENHGWDGSFSNTVMNPAVFAFWARVRYKDGTEDFFRGDVTLVR